MKKLSVRQKGALKNLFILLAVMLFYTILCSGLVVINKYADYDFCKNHYSNEVWTCVFSERYRVVK